LTFDADLLFFDIAMKSSPPLIRELRSLFGFIRGLMIVWLVIVPVSFFGNWQNSKRWGSGFGQMDFKPDSVILRTDSSPNAPVVEGIKLRSLSAELLISGQGEGAKLRQATRTPIIVARVTRTLILLAIAHLLWRLCQAVERGEVFSLGNYRLVRWLGAALVARPIIALVAETWQRASVARYVEDHVWFEGVRPIVTSTGLGWWERAVENTAHFGDFDFSLFVTGLLVLALAEVFRRGLTLKQENDLTV
jgi:hypothetical protein